MPGALTGVYVLDLLRDVYGAGFDDLLLVMIAAALLLTGLLVLLRALSQSEAQRLRERSELDMQTRHKVAAVALGLVIGFVLGVTSAGSGTLIAVGLIIGFRMTPTRSWARTSSTPPCSCGSPPSRT